jgi:uncharacterized protein (TIGR03435 family)
MKSRLRIAAIVLASGAAAAGAQRTAVACTAFCAAGAGRVLVGNNEDWNEPRTKLWFVPAAPGSFGRMYVGFSDLTPQGGMNEHGLWFDGFSAPHVKGEGPSDLPEFDGNIVDAAMARCRTVEEVVRLFEQHNRDFLSQGILMFADASGDAASIERNAIVRKTRDHFVQTNFHQSTAGADARDWRFRTAASMLERGRGAVSVDLFRRILAATHQKGGYPTIYSNVYDLTSRTMHLYYFHDFERGLTFTLDDELKKGARVLDIPSLFPPSAAADALAARRAAAPRQPGPASAAALAAAPLLLLVAAIYGWIRGGRQLRLGLAVLGGTAVLGVVLTGVTLELARKASSAWTQFSIGPASGKSVHIGPGMIRSDGMTLKGAVAFAYDVPAVRVIGPSWLADTRYAVNAFAGPAATASFRSLFQQELKDRLRLETHVEMRPFDVFVLRADGAPRLEPGRGSGLGVSFSQRYVQIQDASMDGFAEALQTILGAPVVNETGIAGSFDAEFGWGDDPVTTVTTVLRDRFGLRLSPGRRDLEALVVDGVRRDAALVLLDRIGRITSAAPAPFGRHIADAIGIR